MILTITDFNVKWKYAEPLTVGVVKEHSYGKWNLKNNVIESEDNGKLSVSLMCSRSNNRFGNQCQKVTKMLMNICMVSKGKWVSLY